ncbi:hypothetical protein [Parafilimonas sp.]|uniref:hypothetical protein n=1 Tax=Parafilimonas sp. TaxID=1969739 RepID=UPI0039E630CB
MFRYILIFLFFITAVAASAQTDATGVNTLQNQEDSLAYYAKRMVYDSMAENRFYCDSVFIRRLVAALKMPYSFEYPFDSLITISRLYAPDSSFRIFTWQLQRDESYYRQEGAIQIKTKDGSLKLFPLFDVSDYTSVPTDSIRTGKNWIGAIYYNIIEKEFKGRKYYTLFGYDDNDMASTRKWLEVLTFNAAGEPVFGGTYFTYKNDELKAPQPVDRFLLEYQKDARARLVYDPDLDMIVFDHLISESNQPQKKFTLIPDGDYEAFKWQNGKWVHVEKLFNQALKDGQAPRPQPLYDKEGSSVKPLKQDN